MRTEKFSVTGMTCAACEANVTRSVKKLNGVSEVTVSLLANQMRVRFDENTVDTAEILRAVADAGMALRCLGKARSSRKAASAANGSAGKRRRCKTNGA